MPPGALCVSYAAQAHTAAARLLTASARPNAAHYNQYAFH